MSNATTIDNTINKLGFRMVIVMILAGIVSLFLPLDAPEGSHAERMLWYSANIGSFTFGWIIQMVAMLTLGAVLAATAWQVRTARPVTAFVAGAAVLISVVAFLIPKFIAIWSIPQMVFASANVTTDAAVADDLLQILNPSMAYSLFSSFDYLGFWMYAVFGLLVALPLIRMTTSARIAGASFGLFGILYHVLFVGVMFGSIASADIYPWFELMSPLLLIAVIAMGVRFRAAAK